MTGAIDKDKSLVDSNGYQFWIWNSLIKDSRIIARVRIIGIENEIYKMEVFQDRPGQTGNYFDCIEKYIKKKTN